MDDNFEIIETFYQESKDLMSAMQNDLLGLEENPDNDELINNVFRCIHTIKGSAGFVDLTEISSFAHAQENVLQMVRNKQISINKELVTVLLEGLDCLKEMIESAMTGTNNIPQERIKSIIQMFDHYTSQAQKSDVRKEEVKSAQIYKLVLNFKEDIFDTDTDPLIFLLELNGLGEIIEANTNISKLPALDRLDPLRFYLSWVIFLKTQASKKEIEEVFLFVKDDNEIEVELCEESYLEHVVETMKDKKIGDILIEKGLVSDEEVNKALAAQKRLGQILIEEGSIMPNKINAIVEQQSQVRKFKEMSTIRVDTGKLDKLMNLVGELVITQARIAQLTSKKEKVNCIELSVSADSLERISRDLQEQIMRVRMVPIESTFSQFFRLVRDLGMQKSKKVQLKVYGKETELDKTIIEQINDPLTHMIRNSVDHGLESPEERKELGKDQTGQIELEAYHESGNIVIEIRDDGRGLDRDKIFSKAVEKRLISSDAQMTDEAVYQLIFNPGFSTADQVSETSGRGVGMDVVKNNISRLRGTIEIYSEKGKGTTFKIQLPLTLAIIDGMLVKVGEEVFVLPILSIVESIQPRKEHVKSIDCKDEVINVRGEYLPLIRLHEVFNIEAASKNPSEALVIIVQSGKTKACLLVDDIIGQQQAVIKSLDDNFQLINGITGATILGDGTVSMILDVPALVKLSE